MNEFVFIESTIDALFPDSSEPLVIHRIGHIVSNAVVDANGIIFNKRSALFERIPS